MSESVIISILAAIPPTIASIGAVIVAMRNGQESKLHNQQSIGLAKEIVAKTDTALVKSDEIHTLVNSNLTQVKEDLATALDRIVKLESIISDMAKKK